METIAYLSLDSITSYEHYKNMEVGSIDLTKMKQI